MSCNCGADRTGPSAEGHLPTCSSIPKPGYAGQRYEVRFTRDNKECVFGWQNKAYGGLADAAATMPGVTKVRIVEVPGWLEKQVLERLKQEQNSKQRWWYLSFAEGEKIKGAVIIRAPGLTWALTKCNQQPGRNPGGAVSGVPFPEGYEPDPSFTDRLMTEKEVKRYFPDIKSLGELENANHYSEDRREAPHPRKNTRTRNKSRNRKNRK